MRVALAGGTGFTGRRVAARLAVDASDLACLVRAGSDRSVLPLTSRAVVGDLADPASLAPWLKGADVLVFVASMGFGHVPGVLEACRRAAVRRVVFVSTTALFTRLPAPSKVVRLAAEKAVQESGLDWTIVRPTMIYGAPGDRNMERLLRAVVRWPFLFVPGSGRSLIQPVHVDDLAQGIVAAAQTDDAIGRAFNLSGAAPLAFDAAIAAVREAAGRRCPRVHLPLGPVVFLLRALERVGLRLRISSEQVLRLDEDKAFPHDEAAEVLGFAPRSFVEGITHEARQLGLTAERDA